MKILQLVMDIILHVVESLIPRSQVRHLGVKGRVHSGCHLLHNPAQASVERLKFSYVL
jgi:hypothetical protein